MEKEEEEGRRRNNRERGNKRRGGGKGEGRRKERMACGFGRLSESSLESIWVLARAPLAPIDLDSDG